jgi:hypothetical protein
MKSQASAQVPLTGKAVTLELFIYTLGAVKSISIGLSSDLKSTSALTQSVFSIIILEPDVVKGSLIFQSGSE